MEDNLLERFPSFELVGREVERQFDTQMRHFEGIDTKAGVILGFAATFVALTFRIDESVIQAAGIVASLSGMAALSAFWPRKYPLFDLKRLRDKYLTAQASFTAIHFLDTRIEMERVANRTIRSKALRLEMSLFLLLGAIGLATAGIIVR